MAERLRTVRQESFSLLHRGNMPAYSTVHWLMHHKHLPGQPPVLRAEWHPPLSRPDSLCRHTVHDAIGRFHMPFSAKAHSGQSASP